MKKRTKALAVAAIAILTLSISSCDLYTEDPIEIMGTWMDPLYGSTIIVTEDGIDFGYYQADFSNHSNEKWNAGESSLATGDFGFAVIRYTSAPPWNPDLLGKYMVFRWKDFDSGSGLLSFSEGYNNGTYFEDELTACAEATDAAGYFSMYTVGAEKQ